MNKIDIVIKNLMRRKGKALFMLAGLVIGVSTVVATMSYTGAMTNDINKKIEKYGANILILPGAENLSLSYGGFSLGDVSFDLLEIKEADLKNINTIKNSGNIAALGPIVLGGVIIKKKRVLIAGVDFVASRVLKPWWRMDGPLPQKGALIAGSEAARLLNISQGDSVTVRGRKMRVASILNETGSQDDQLIFSDMKSVQSILGKKGRVSMVEVAALCSGCPVDDMVKQISAVLPGTRVMAIQQVVKNRMDMLSHLKKLGYGLSIVISIIGGLVVMVTMMGSVRDRTDEIGIFRAIGFRKGHVVWIVLVEAGVISAFAGVTGYLFGALGAGGILRFSSETAISTGFDPWFAGAVLWGTILMGLLASIYPAIIASRMNPVEALRAL